MVKDWKKILAGGLVALALGVDIAPRHKEPKIPYLRRDGVVFLRLPQIPVDVNQVDDPSYQNMLRKEVFKCMSDENYFSPYASDYLFDFVGFDKTPVERLLDKSRDYWRSLMQEEEPDEVLPVPGDNCLAP